MPETFYLDKLYPFQNQVLEAIERLDLDFYLTGGTALSRCYLQHRYSEDLDFFVNDHIDFKKQCVTAIDALKKKWPCDLAVTSESFVRIFLQGKEVALKVDFVNDVAAHFGDIEESSVFFRTDNWRNILSNKICALSRLEAKDVADIIFIARRYSFEWETIIDEAKEKDLWVEPIEICRLISQFPTHLLKAIQWISDVNFDLLEKHIHVVHNDIFTGSENSLNKFYHRDHREHRGEL